MGKLYVKNSEVDQNLILKEELLGLVEQFMAKNEKQSIFRSLYDLEIMGITIYYNKKWSYENLNRNEEDESHVALAGVGA